MLLDYLKWKNWIKLFLKNSSSLQRLFHKRVIGQSKKVSGEWIHLIGFFFFFWYVWLKLRKKPFFEKVPFSKASDPRTLCLSKIGLVSLRSFTKFANIKERNAIQKKKMPKKRIEITSTLNVKIIRYCKVIN